jgi:radical SAM enzyme (rSAM/lipoprotein system)
MNVSKLSLRKKLGLDLNLRLQKDVIEEHHLRQLFWECTLRCNLHCRHCGSDCKAIAGTKDMPKEDFFKVLDDVSAVQDPHKVFVVITGGEPLMRDDLEQCGLEIYRKGFPWGLVSNGLFLSPKRFNGLLEAGLHSITVSIDGLKDNHNWMRGNAKSFERVSQAIDLMVNEPTIVYDLVTCVTEHNFAELPALRDFLIDKGVKAWRLFTVFPLGRAAKDPDMKLTDEHFKALLDFIKTTRKEGHIHASYGCEGFLGNYETEVRDNFFFCNAGVNTASVLADGSISACPSIRANYHQGNIYTDDFMEVWQTRFQKYRDRQWMKQGECAECKYFKYCRGNGMHLHDDDGKLLFCHLHRLQNAK